MLEFGRAPFVGAQLHDKAADYFGVAGLHGTSRRPELVMGRWSFILVMLDELPCSERWVARFLNQHHSTISHAYRRAKQLRRTDPIFYDACEYLRESIS